MSIVLKQEVEELRQEINALKEGNELLAKKAFDDFVVLRSILNDIKGDLKEHKENFNKNIAYQYSFNGNTEEDIDSLTKSASNLTQIASSLEDIVVNYKERISFLENTPLRKRKFF